MELTAAEERALAGEEGAAVARAYELLLATGKVLGATRLIPIAHAHVSGVSLLTIGDAGAEFLGEFSREARVRVPTTVNPCGIDVARWWEQGVDPEYAARQLQVVDAYRRMGVQDSFSCIPYDGAVQLPPGTTVSWAESSAVIYANSVLGLRTNRESGVTALASAVTGKTPFAGLHLDTERQPRLVVRVRVPIATTLEAGLLGYFAGRLTDGTVGFAGVSSLLPEQAKALSAALGTSGASGMFALEAPWGVETVDYERRNRDATFAELGGSEKAEAVVLGCPQLLRREVLALGQMLAGRRFRVPCLVFCPRWSRGDPPVVEALAALVGAGARIACDACADFTPLVRQLGVSRVATDSCKGAHYMRRVHGVEMQLVATEELVQAYTE